MKKLLSALLVLVSNPVFAQSNDLKGVIEAQSSTVFATAESSANTSQQVCFEFGKLLGLGLAYKIYSPDAPLEKYINETVALYSVSCSGKKLSKSQRGEISELSESIFKNIRK